MSNTRADSSQIVHTSNGSAVTRSLSSKLNDIVSVKDFGAVGDGVTDDTAAIQSCIDANKGKKICITGGTFLVAGLVLDGTSYDDTEIVCIDSELKLKGDAAQSTFGGAWVGLLVRDCNRVMLDLKWHGNRDLMTQTREQIYCVALAGAIDINIQNLSFREIQGDGLYIAQKDWSTNSNPSRRVNIGSVSGHNSADFGRNLVTIISVAVCNINSVLSFQVGGVINGVRQPGGIDIEPDQGYHLCEDITIGNVNVVTAGTVGLGVLGKPYTNDSTGDWNTKNVSVGNYEVRFTNASSGGVAFTRCFDLNVRGSTSYDVGVRNKGVTIDFASRVKADLKTKGCTVGLNIGPIGSVANFEINLISSDFGLAGLRSTSCSFGKFTGRCYGSDASFTTFGVQCHNEGRSGITQTNVVYELDIPYDNVMARAFRNEPGNTVSYVSTYARNCDWTGYASYPATNDALIYLENVRGMTDGYAIPSNGTWVTSTFVKNLQPVIGGGKIQFGWVRLTSGTGNVAATDWSPCYTTTS